MRTSMLMAVIAFVIAPLANAESLSCIDQGGNQYAAKEVKDSTGRGYLAISKKTLSASYYAGSDVIQIKWRDFDSKSTINTSLHLTVTASSGAGEVIERSAGISLENEDGSTNSLRCLVNIHR